MTVKKVYLDEIDVKVLRHLVVKHSEAVLKECNANLELTKCKTKIGLQLKKLKCWYWHNVCMMWHYAFNFYLNHTGFME